MISPTFCILRNKLIRTAIISLALAGAVVVAGCGKKSADDVATASGASPAVSRGFTATVIPTWVRSGPERRAAGFVAVAASPDARLDQAPGDAWRRATSMMAPALVAELKGSSLGNVPGWGRLKRLGGYVVVEISNVVGDEPQAAPGPAAPSEGQGPVKVEVVFTRIIRVEGQRDVREAKPVVWMVTVSGDQITGLATVSTTSE